ncbi:MAG TPA: carboxypeptidase regulatory-like domain-containing protein [Longimicrobium sp.]|nr:carboxypeptidase regulatory-like domain-containing protein [Longimicrobium sp.]
MHRIRPFLLSLLLALLPGALPAQTDVITGRVTDEAGAPLAGVRIQVLSLESEVTRSTATNADGRYTVAFPDGGGRYRVTASQVGRASATQAVARQADEDVLVANFRLGERAVQLEAISVQAQRTPPPGRGEAGGQERFLGSEVVNRLPLEDQDPARLATLSPGVVATDADSTSGRGGFSVAGQRASQNEITLDGSSFSSRLTGGQAGGGSPVGIPQEGVRGTQVVTSTYDVSRGQFSGGLVATTTRSGTNRFGGSASWQLRSPALQLDAGTPQYGGGYTQNRFSGGFGGPIIRDRLFYYLSFTAQRRVDDLYALQPRDRATLELLGVSPAAVDTFLNVLGTRYGVSGRSGTYERTGDAFSVLGRTDVVLTQKHNLALRGHLNVYGQENARIGFLETLQNGGEVGTRGGGGIATLTSRFGESWVNELRASYNLDRREQTPYEEVPEGRVRVASVLEETGRGFSTLVFGGERSLPSLSRERTMELANELSFLFRDQHRIKAGLLVNHTSFDQEQTNNRLGSFEFESLDKLAAGQPFRYTRSLSPRVQQGSGLDAALYLGDTWRPRTQVQIVFGARVETSRFDETPEHNPRVEQLFGVRTDRLPTEWHVSPRMGFSWRMNEQGAPLRLLRGGIGEFRGRAPYSLFAAAIDQTGLSTGETQLECVGEAAVPIPDWQAYLADPSTVPTTCRDGSPGGGLTQSRAPNVTVFGDGFGAPRTWRGSLGYQTQLFRRFSASLDVSHAYGVSQFGVVDLNLREAPVFTLAAEGGRPVYAPAAAISPASGAVPLQASRRFTELAQVYRVDSDLESRTTQVSLGLQGLLPRRILFQGSYTWSRSRDQSSFSGGSPQSGFSQSETRGDPNLREWATSDLERRHSIVTTFGLPLSSAVEVSFIGRLSSGRPFTPMVGADVNGDGARNDAAFVFDPATVSGDTALAAGMQRLLGSVSGRVRECLEDQMGQVARRNSCRAEWSGTLDMRATLRPQIRGMGRRLSVSVDASNLAAGLDQVLHGSQNLRGWGQAGMFRPDDALLYPDSFDVANQRFLYRVNENFGSRRTAGGFGGFGGGGSAFQVMLSARVTVGAQQQGGGGGGFGGGGGGFGGGGRGGFGGPGGQGGGGQGQFDPALVLERMLPDPIDGILQLRDTLRLTEEQVARIEAIGDSLEVRNDSIRAQITQAFTAAGGGQGGNANMGEVFQRIQPQIQAGRRNIQQALDAARAVMTPEQWRRVPAALRNAAQSGGFGPRD